MKGTLFSADFVTDNLGNQRLLEINTDTGILDSAFPQFDFSQLYQVLTDNNITEFYTISKPAYHHDFVNFLSQSLNTNVPSVTTFVNVEQATNAFWISNSPEDTNNRFILRLAYDEAALFDSEYAKGTLNLLKLFADNGDSGSVVEFYHSSSLNGNYNTISSNVINPSNVPDVAIKSVEENVFVPISFYKIGNEGETNQNRWSSFIEENSSETKMIQQYHFDSNSVLNNKVTSLRTFSILYGPNLDLMLLAGYSIPSILELPNNLVGEYDSNNISNQLSPKHHYEYTTNFIKFPKGLDGILESHKIKKSDGTFVEIKDVQLEDVVDSYYVATSPQTENPIEIAQWGSIGPSLPSGSYLTSSVVMYKNIKPLQYNTLNEIVVGSTDSVFVATNKAFLLYNSGSNEMKFRASIEIEPENDFFIDNTGSLVDITENNIYITNEDSLNIVEIDVEDTDTYLISGSFSFHSIVAHNSPCFVAGTQVITDNGSKNIEDIKVGENVLTYNHKTNENEYKEVMEVISKSKQKTVKYLFENGTELECTLDHPLFSKDMGYVSYDPIMTFNGYQMDVKKAEVGLGILMENGEVSNIKSIVENEDLNTVYNLKKVKDNHNFYANNLLVHNRVCFIKGTKVTMADGSVKNIEDIKIGEEVLSYNETTGFIEPKKVVDTQSPMHDDLVKYTFSNENYVTCTLDHPFYVNNFDLASFAPSLTNERYVLPKVVKKIEIGDLLYSLSNQVHDNVTLLSIEELLKEVVETHIITVEDNHNFYANGILTHNK